MVWFLFQALDGSTTEGVPEKVSTKKMPGPPVKKQKPNTTDDEIKKLMKITGEAISKLTVPKPAPEPAAAPVPVPVPPVTDHFSEFGAFIASRLRQMHPDDCKEKEKRLVECLFNFF